MFVDINHMYKYLQSHTKLNNLVLESISWHVKLATKPYDTNFQAGPFLGDMTCAVLRRTPSLFNALLSLS